VFNEQFEQFRAQTVNECLQHFIAACDGELLDDDHEVHEPPIVLSLGHAQLEGRSGMTNPRQSGRVR
jgi:hypothetical protein